MGNFINSNRSGLVLLKIIEIVNRMHVVYDGEVKEQCKLQIINIFLSTLFTGHFEGLR